MTRTLLATGNSTATTGLDLEYAGSVLWIVINVLLIILIVIGNILTICAILMCKKLSSMVANQFIFSLALSDLLVGFSVPYHMLFYMTESIGSDRSTCIIRFVLLLFAFSSSVHNLLLIATDRYMAIVYPLHHIRFMTRKLSIIMILIGWGNSLTLATILFGWNEWNETVQCDIVHIIPDEFMNFLLTPFCGAIWFALFFLYTRIFREAAGQSKRIKNTKIFQTVQVMMTILGCFTVCWMPFFVEITYGRFSRPKRTSPFYEITFTLAITNSGLNPIVYAWKNSNFRKTFICLIKCTKPDNIVNSNQYITNHVPNNSKKNSLYSTSMSLNNKNGTGVALNEGETRVQIEDSHH